MNSFNSTLSLSLSCLQLVLLDTWLLLAFKLILSNAKLYFITLHYITFHFISFHSHEQTFFFNCIALRCTVISIQALPLQLITFINKTKYKWICILFCMKNFLKLSYDYLIKMIAFVKVGITIPCILIFRTNYFTYSLNSFWME